jgi:hypothetical protein
MVVKDIDCFDKDGDIVWELKDNCILDGIVSLDLSLTSPTVGGYQFLVFYFGCRRLEFKRNLHGRL